MSEIIKLTSIEHILKSRGCTSEINYYNSKKYDKARDRVISMLERIKNNKGEEMKKLLLKKIIMIFIIIGFFTVDVYAIDISVENLTIKRGCESVWSLYGIVRNMETYPIAGYVKIKFLNSNNDVVKSVTTYVNDRDPIQSGQAASFEFHTKSEDFNEVSSYQFIFVDVMKYVQ